MGLYPPREKDVFSNYAKVLIVLEWALTVFVLCICDQWGKRIRRYKFGVAKGIVMYMAIETSLLKPLYHMANSLF